MSILIHSQRRGAWGFVLRSDQGTFLADTAGTIEHVKSALHAEATACVVAVDGASHLRVYRVMLESDSSTLVHALKTFGYDLSEFGVLLRDIRRSYIIHFDEFEFCFCHHDCNKVAHEFAQYGVRAGLPISECIEHSLDFFLVW
jgi:hypothetical protein